MKKRIVILGAAESGVGAALLAHQQGYDVFVSDAGTIKENYKSELKTSGISFEEGFHTEEKILNADNTVAPGLTYQVGTHVRKIRGKQCFYCGVIQHLFLKFILYSFA